VSLDEKNAKVEVDGEADVAAMIAAIEEEGYEAALK
jgi:copper chaperone CopZ